jgi:integrase
MKFTIRTIGTLKPDPDGDVFAWDDEVAGFGVRVKPSGVRSFMLQYRNASGNSRRLTLGKLGVLTPDEARKLAKERLAEVAKGGDPAEQRTEQRKAMTVGELCTAYIEAVEQGLVLGKKNQPKKSSTIYTDKGRIERHIRPLLGNKKVRDLKTPDIAHFMRDVTTGETAVDVKTGLRGRAIVKGGVGTASRTVGLLGGILSYAVSEGIIAINPVRGFKRPADKHRKIRLTDEQFREFGKALAKAEARGENKTSITAMKLLALTGCRRGEIEQLKWSDVDLDGNCLRLSDSKEGESVRPMGSAAKTLLMEQPQTSIFVFPRLVSKKQKEKSSHKKGKVPEEKPFSGLPKAWLRIKKIAAENDDGEKVELPPNLTPHGLRHAFASVASNLGYTEPTIAAMLGHASGTITSRYILHLDTVLVAAADRVSMHIAAALNGDEKTSKAGAKRDNKSGAHPEKKKGQK